MKDEFGSTKLDEFRLKMNELEKAKREADRVRQEAIAELLQKRKEITRQLRQLGYEGEAPEPDRIPASDGGPGLHAVPLFPDVPGAPRRKRLIARNGEDRRCPVCEVSGHDLRAHRGQVHKRPFSADELKARGLSA